MTITNTIESKCREFAEELTVIIRSELLAALGGALTEEASRAPRLAAVHSAAERARGEKRPPALLAELTEELARYIQDNPGLGIEVIARGMECSSRELNLPIKKLLATKRIRAVGQKRATKYHPVKRG